MKHKIVNNKFRSVKTGLILLAALLFSTKSTVLGQENSVKQWSYSVGIGTAIIPSYLGDNNYQAVLFPNFTATYANRFSASLFEGLRYNAAQFGAWRIGVILKFNVGRFEDGTLPGRVIGSNTNDLIGLGDIDFSIEPGAFIEFTGGQIASIFTLRRGFGGHEGLIAEIRSEFKEELKVFGKSIQYAIGPMIRTTNSEYNNTFFGTDQSQAQESNIGVYRPTSSALSLGINGSLIIPMSGRLSTILYFSYLRLGDPIAESNLIRQYGSRHQMVNGIMFSYSL